MPIIIGLVGGAAFYFDGIILRNRHINIIKYYNSFAALYSAMVMRFILITYVKCSQRKMICACAVWHWHIHTIALKLLHSSQITGKKWSIDAAFYLRYKSSMVTSLWWFYQHGFITYSDVSLLTENKLIAPMAYWQCHSVKDPSYNCHILFRGIVTVYCIPSWYNNSFFLNIIFIHLNASEFCVDHDRILCKIPGRICNREIRYEWMKCRNDFECKIRGPSQ